MSDISRSRESASGKRPGLIGIAADHEDMVDLRPLQPLDETGQLQAVLDHPGREVRHRLVAALTQLDGEVEGGVHPLGRTGRDRDIAARPGGRRPSRGWSSSG